MTRRKIPTFFWEYRGHKPPAVDIAGHLLRIGGGSMATADFSLERLNAVLPRMTVERRFYCVNGWSLPACWQGYRIADLIEYCKPGNDTPYLRATSIGGYEDTTSIARLIAGDALLVTHMNGEPLSVERGQPMRLMVFDMYQFKGVKAVGRLEFVSSYRPGTWEKVGYSDATVKAYPHLCIDSGEELMPDAAVLVAGRNHPPINLNGPAFCGNTERGARARKYQQRKQENNIDG